MRWLAKGLCLVLLILMQKECNAFSNDTTDVVNKKALRLTIASEALAYSGAMSSLYFVWYKDQQLTSFHFFNDSREWMQMDKAGHFGTAALFAEYSFDLYRHCGLSKRKAAWLGASQAMFFLSSLEIMDGFSSDWGFSWSDMGANLAGAGFFLMQHLGEGDRDSQKFRVKFSSHLSQHAQWRPEVLGQDFSSRMLKDYNGQTFWLSVNPHDLFNFNASFPRWLNIAFGYGAEGMLGGTSNPVYNNRGQTLPQFDRMRQYYFSLDIDLRKIPVKRKWMKVTLSALNWIKIPFPALGYSQGKFSLHPFYF